MPIFLRYGDIKGDVKEPAHRGWIELTSFQWGVGRSVTSVGSATRESSAPSVSEIVVTKLHDSASTRLFNESVAGQGTKAIIDFVKGDGTVYLRLVLDNTMVSGYSISGGGGATRPSETVTLNFTKVEFQNLPGTPAQDGTPHAVGYDLTLAKP